MRKLLLASVALAGAAVYLPTAARAQSPVFPETTRAGKLDGAAPGSVSVSIGGTFFGGIEFQGGKVETTGTDPVTGLTVNTGTADPKKTEPNLVNYIRLYPNFDYASPSGLHFGVTAEIRSNGGRNRNDNTLYWHSAAAYVSGEKFGKFEFGTPPDAADALGVGTSDNFGTGGDYGEYGWPSAPSFAMADAYDGDIPHQKLTYLSPIIAGFALGVSYQPNATGLTNNGGFTSEGDYGLSHNRYSGAAQFSHAFGPASLKASVAYTGSGVGSADAAGAGATRYRDVSMLNGGVDVTVAGFELEGSVNTGKFAFNNPVSGTSEPEGGPIARGSKSTTAYIGGVGYTFGPATIGFQYYHVDFDASQIGGTFGEKGKTNVEALGGSYAVGPGVNLNFDIAHSDMSGAGYAKTHGYLAAVGTYFAW